jgi:hypothetical protein
MKRSTSYKLVCGLAAAVVLGAACSDGKAAPPPYIKVYPAKIYTPVVVRPMMPPPVVVRSYPVYPAYRPTVVYREPVIVANPAPAPIDVTIVNPESTGTTLSFTISGVRYTLVPGSEQQLHFGGPRMITFDRGSSFGLARLPLRDGVYTFIAAERGWGLQYEAN